MSNDRYDVEARPSDSGLRGKTKLLYVSTAKYGGDWHSMPHTHTCAELFYVVGGLGRFRIAELTHQVAADDLVIVNPGVEHTEVSLNQNPLEYIVLGVEGLEFSGSEDWDDRFRIVNFRGGGEDMLYCLHSMLREMASKPPGYETICQDLLEILLIRLMRRTDFAMTLAPPSPLANKECAAVRRYIDGHFKENITLDMLAELTHMNKYYMVHLFSREYGISPINYLISRRIQESRYLLAGTDHSLSQISHMLGFSSPSYFSQSFRKLEEVSPMEYRKCCRSRPADFGETPYKSSFPPGKSAVQ